MGSDALRYPIADTLYQEIRSSGMPILKRLNLAQMMLTQTAASRRGEPVYEEIRKIKASFYELRKGYMKAYDNSTDDVPNRAEYEHLLYECLEDVLEIVTKERLISGSIMERLAGEKFGKGMKSADDEE